MSARPIIDKSSKTLADFHIGLTEKHRKMLYKNQTVTIEYDESFRKEYPHTFARFHGKTGRVTEFISHQGDSIIALRFDLEAFTTLVDRRYIREAKG